MILDDLRGSPELRRVPACPVGYECQPGSDGRRGQAGGDPIFKSHTVYQRHRRTKQSGKPLQQAFDAEQPFHADRNPHLWLLQELAAEQRHHLIRPVAANIVCEEHHITGT